jgi:negative regulator of sigma E activity
MTEETLNTRDASLEGRSRALFRDSVERIDMRTRSRLTQARHAALQAAERARPRAWFMRMPVLTSAAGVAAATVLGVSLWLVVPQSHHGAAPADSTASFEDLDIVAASDNSQDNVEMLQDDLDFYDWADKSNGSDPPTA